MSLLNIWISPGEALVLVDTAARMRGVDGQLRDREAQKLFHFAHSNIVMGWRGEGAIAADVYHAIHMARDPIDLDMMERIFPLELEAIRERHADRMRSIGLVDSNGHEVELAFIGYSRKRGSMAGFVCTVRAGEQSFSTREISRWMLAPEGSWDSLPVAPDNVDLMVAHAKIQVKNSRSVCNSQFVIGTRLLLAHLTADTYSLRTVALEQDGSWVRVDR